MAKVEQRNCLINNGGDETVTYAPPHVTQQISHRSVGRGMGLPQALPPCSKEARTGRPTVHRPRKILNAVFYLLKSGCPWRLLPRDFPSCGRPSITGSGSGASTVPS